MSADRPCSHVLSQLLGRSLSEAHRSRVHETFPIALTHAIDEVREYAVWGIARHISSTNRKLALRCVNALVTEANLIKQVWDVEAQPYPDPGWRDTIESEAAQVIRQHFWEDGFIPTNSCQPQDIKMGTGARAYVRILAILSQMPTDPVAIAVFKGTAEKLVELWHIKSERRHDQSRGISGWDYENKLAASMRLQEFAMRTSNDAA